MVKDEDFRSFVGAMRWNLRLMELEEKK